MAHYQLTAKGIKRGKAVYTLTRDGEVIQAETLYSGGIDYVQAVGEDTDTFSDSLAMPPQPVAELRAQEAVTREKDALYGKLYFMVEDWVKLREDFIRKHGGI